MEKTDLINNLYKLKIGLGITYVDYQGYEKIVSDAITIKERIQKEEAKLKNNIVEKKLLNEKEDSLERMNPFKKFFNVKFWVLYFVAVFVLTIIGAVVDTSYIFSSLVFLIFGFVGSTTLAVCARKIESKRYVAYCKNLNNQIEFYKTGQEFAVSLKEKQDADAEVMEKDRDSYECALRQYGEQVDLINDKYEILVKSFSDSISPLDWHELDCILYYLQTNRADTIKEALIQLDEQRRNDRLVDTITGATQYLGNQIVAMADRIVDAISELGQSFGKSVQSLEKSAIATATISSALICNSIEKFRQENE